MFWVTVIWCTSIHYAFCVCVWGGWGDLKFPSNSHHQQYNLYVKCVHIFNRKYHTLTVILAYVLAIFMGYIYVVKNVVFFNISNLY